MFRWFDYLIVILPLIGVYSLGLYVRRYIRSVSDFVSAGRMCGRYLITVGDVANAIVLVMDNMTLMPSFSHMPAWGTYSN